MVDGSNVLRGRKACHKSTQNPLLIIFLFDLFCAFLGVAEVVSISAPAPSVSFRTCNCWRLMFTASWNLGRGSDVSIENLCFGKKPSVCTSFGRSSLHQLIQGFLGHVSQRCEQDPGGSDAKQR